MIHNLQILRALAAYLVFLTHFGLYAGPLLPRADALAFGAAGVDVFFVLSGFIMCVSTAGRDETPAGFLARRASRVVPAYWLVTLVLALIAAAGLRPIGIIELRPEYVVQSLLFLPFSRGGYVEPLNSVGWTLNYEMFFYAAFALLLPVRPLGRRTLAAGAAFLGLVCLGTLPVPGLYWTYYTRPIVIEFAAGMTLGWAYLRLAPGPVRFPAARRSVRLGAAALVLGAALILGGQAAAWILGAQAELTGFVRPLVWGSAAVLIVGGMLALQRGGIVLRTRWLLAQGDASYAFYLVHNLMLHAAAKAAALVVAPGAVRALLILVLALGASTALAGVLHRRFEVPVGAALRRRIDRGGRAGALPNAA